MGDRNIKAVIEALLFSSERPLTLEQLKGALGAYDSSEIRKLIEELKQEYETVGRGIRINEVAGGFQLITAALAVPFLKKLYKQRRVERLSKPALETLAIVAYKQPVTRVEIASLRSVNIDGVVENLLEKELLRICGRKKAPGRPFVYGTTRKFLEYFGLKSLDELPKIGDFSKLAVVDSQPKELKEQSYGAKEIAAGS